MTIASPSAPSLPPQYKFLCTPMSVQGAAPADLVPDERPDAFAGKGIFVAAELQGPPSLLRARMVADGRRRREEAEALASVPPGFALKWALVNGARGVSAAGGSEHDGASAAALSSF